MIGIITYISVLERTKEIGILRAIGASKKDISRVFNAETTIIGLTSGVMGIVIAVLLDLPISHIIENMSGIADIAKLPVQSALILILIQFGADGHRRLDPGPDRIQKRSGRSPAF
ncbi:MAG: FtsX-like permease family protein [Catenisphaera adipataccumulans]|uniref:FtsX-like permease family protein n=1 Tax=Catenisphaera adipataccumulans TaxID=700500 RepID=UPI003D8AEF02